MHIYYLNKGKNIQGLWFKMAPQLQWM